MNPGRKFESFTRQELLLFFNEIDAELDAQSTSLIVTVLGGVSIILLGFRDRITVDIDIANSGDALDFQKHCLKKGIPVDIITVASTVDFSDAPTVELYRGRNLVVRSVMAENLIKLKLERFRKQDPEDIYAIIEKTKMNFERFQSLVKEMLPDFIGNPQELILSARLVVETLYPERASDPPFFHR